MINGDRLFQTFKHDYLGGRNALKINAIRAVLDDGGDTQIVSVLYAIFFENL